MPIAAILTEFQQDASQCDNLIASAHRSDPVGTQLFSQRDRAQITVAAFLNLYVAWESFLESAIAEFSVGGSTLSGASSVKYVSPPTSQWARSLLIGVNRYFDYANPDSVRKIVSLYFENGYPFQPHLNAIASDLMDLRTMRNASAHLSSTTQAALEGLAQRILGAPAPGIELYSLLLRNDPRTAPVVTVIAGYEAKLLVTAELIAQG